MAKVHSFISEHTAEYFILASLMPGLLRKFNKAIPFFYWAGREGNNLSEACGSDQDYYRVLCIYPRRPKVMQKDSPTIQVKINEYMWPPIMTFKNSGIPVLAAVPNISSLFDVDWNTITSSWFQLLQPCQDFEFELQLKPVIEVKTSVEPCLSKLLSIEEICTIVERSNHKSWCDILEIIRKSRQNIEHRSMYGWYGNYRPIFILVQ